MQGKINSFRAAFVDLAADYVKRVAVRAAQQEPEAKGAAQQFRYELANDIQIANTLAETIEKMQKNSGRELPQGGAADSSPSASGFNCTAAPSPVEVFTLNTVPSGKFQRVFPSRKSRRKPSLSAWPPCGSSLPPSCINHHNGLFRCAGSCPVARSAVF